MILPGRRGRRPLQRTHEIKMQGGGLGPTVSPLAESLRRAQATRPTADDYQLWIRRTRASDSDRIARADGIRPYVGVIPLLPWEKALYSFPLPVFSSAAVYVIM